ncbi:hypothetical protein B9J78_01895 [bacterium Unc6]|nr:hypothetical protein [bacterium Unc6]
MQSKRKIIQEQFLKLSPVKRIETMERILKEHIKIRALRTGKTEYEVYQEYLKIGQKKFREV